MANSKNPPQVPQGLPSGEDDKLKRQQDEADIKKVLPEPETEIGKDTVGVGQPDAQAVSQGQSLPQSAIPVEKKFEKDQFYDPNKTEVAIDKKDRIERGGAKTDL